MDQCDNSPLDPFETPRPGRRCGAFGNRDGVDRHATVRERLLPPFGAVSRLRSNAEVDVGKRRWRFTEPLVPKGRDVGGASHAEPAPPYRGVRESPPHLEGALLLDPMTRVAVVHSIKVEDLVNQFDGADFFEL